MLHALARKGQLSDSDRQHYTVAREQLARALTSAQGLTVEPGQSARRTFRVAQGLQVDLSLDSGPLRAMTMDVSCGGFSVMMHQPPARQAALGFSLRLPGGAEPLVGRALVASTQRKIGNHRVSFVFQALPEQDLERLEMALFDLALERLE
jgi:hypothetical protein